MKRDTKRIGAVSELRVMAALVRSGYNVLVPYGDSARYDAVIEDENGTLERVQIKIGRLRKGTIEFKAFSTHIRKGKARMQTYVGQIDYFGIYCAQVHRCYLVPANEVVTGGSLRIDPPRNGQAKSVRWAKPYEIGASRSVQRVGENVPDVVVSPSKLPL